MSFRLKDYFFDSKAVTNATDRATRKVLSKFGAFVRRTARDLTRRKGTKKKRSSQPGQPPFRHTGNLRRLIYFAFDPQSKSVVIGPEKYKSGNIPEVLEYGGPVVTEAGPVSIEARPFMGPAYQENEPKLAGMWRDSIG